jgi:hypothetical protein
VSVTIPAFWQMLADSRLLGREQCQSLAADYARLAEATDQGSAKALAEWLVSRNVLSKYQATILLAGRAGPFLYGEYKVYDRVDKGRLAGLFRAVHGPTGHPVLLAFASGPALADPHQWAASAASAWAAAAIVSPNVQRWFEPVDALVYKFFVSEDLRGTTAEERMTGSRFPPAEACRIARLAALGLERLHQAGRVHGDVRPANLLLVPIPGLAAHVKLLWNPHEPVGPWNLGEEPPGPRLSAAADFLAPELAAPGYPPDALTDLYALGCALYTMLAGAPPFAGGSIAEKMTRHATEAIRPLEQLGVPQPLAQLVAYLMAKNPAVRYQSAALVAEQLAMFVEPAALYAQPPPPPPTLAGFEASLASKRPPVPPPPPTAATPTAAPPEAAPFPVVGQRKIPFSIETFGPTAEPTATLPQPAAFPAAIATRPVIGLPTDWPLAAPPIPPLAAATPPFAPPVFAPPAPPPGAGTASVPPPPPAAAGADAPPALVLDISAPVPAKIAPLAPAAPATTLVQRTARRQRQQLATAAGVIVACVAVAVVSVIVLLNSELFKEPGGADVATRDPTKSPSVKPAHTREGGQPAVTPASSGASGSNTAPATGASGGTSSTATAPTAPTVAPAAGDGLRQEIVPDDAKLLWASPTTGPPISERLIPPDPQMFVFARPADIVASSEGERVLAALGPVFAAGRSAWEKASGLSLAEIEQLLVTLHPNQANFPRASFVVRTKDPFAPDELLKRWNNPIPTLEGMATYYLGGGWAYYISPSPDDPRTFVMGDPRDVQEVVKVAGNPPQIMRDVRRMLRTTDQHRHVTIVAVPTFLLNDDGEPLFAAERARLRQPLAWLLGDGVQAASASFHFGPELYVELRLLGTLDKEPFLLSSEVKSRLDRVPGEIENYLVGLSPPPYWKKLSFRYPEMVRQLHEQLRGGVENDQAVFNAVLPGVAAHNLVLGGELLVASAPGGEAAAVASGSPPAKALPKTLDEALQRKTTFTFAQQSLEFAMRDLALDAADQLKGSGVEFAIKILGGDLEKDGITRNQSVRDFDQKDRTFAEILTALVRKANPDPSAKGPDDPAQKLIWVVGPDPDDASKQVILITTRAAAETNKYTLPPEFIVKEEPKKKGK